MRDRVLLARFSTICQRVMNDKAYTQADLAARLHIPVSSLQNYLQQRRQAPWEVLIALSKEAGMSIDEILKEGTDSPKGSASFTDSPGAVCGSVTFTDSDVTYGDRITGGDEPITKRQADRLRAMVNQIVDVQKQNSLKPRTPGAIWNMVFRRLHVEEIWEIRQSDFRTARNLLTDLLDGKTLPDLQPAPDERTHLKKK